MSTLQDKFDALVSVKGVASSAATDAEAKARAAAEAATLAKTSSVQAATAETEFDALVPDDSLLQSRDGRYVLKRNGSVEVFAMARPLSEVPIPEPAPEPAPASEPTPVPPEPAS